MYLRPKNYIKTYTLNLGEELGAEKADDVFVILREPSIIELTDIDSNGAGTAALKALMKALPSFIVDHNIFIDEAKKATNEEVVETISANIAASVKLLNDYLKAVRSPFQKAKESK
jgi:hypothetical protein